MIQAVKNQPAIQETKVLSLDREDPLEKGMATHSSILAWRISWIEEPGRLQSMGSQELEMTSVSSFFPKSARNNTQHAKGAQQTSVNQPIDCPNTISPRARCSLVFACWGRGILILIFPLLSSFQVLAVQDIS